MALVCMWGAAYCFLAWVPCIPVNGFSSITGAMAAFTSFAATNMALDTIIFLIPISKYFKPGLGHKEYLALTTLFTLGAMYVFQSPVH